MLAKLLGEEGTVTGVDATAAQLAIANRHLDCHRDRVGFAKSNVCFVEGDIESLDALGLPECRYNAIVSNCVINPAERTAVYCANGPKGCLSG